MHIKIVGFKCHVDVHYDFNVGEIILMKGPSGSGKSTILQAIFWCLYGSMRGIYNNTGEIKSCSVTLSINDLVIYRQKRPELLKVSININNTENNYEDIVAQQIIIQAFGTKKLWKSCSYIGQKDRCSLLSGSSYERLELLNQLSFDNNNPKEYISRIDKELKSVNNNFIITQSNFTTELNLFTKELTDRPVTNNIHNNDIEKISINIQTLELDIKNLYIKVLEHERSQGSYDILENQIKSCETQINNINTTIENKNTNETYNKKINIIQSEIEELKFIFNKITIYEETKKRIKTIQFKIDQVDIKICKVNIDISTYFNIDTSGDIINIVPTDEQIWYVSNQEILRTRYIQECKNLGCNYDKLYIDTMITNMKDQIKTIQNMEKNIATFTQLKSIQLKLKNLSIDQHMLTLDHIKNLETNIHDTTVHISELKKGQELFLCPECSKPLRYVNNKLVSGERPPVTEEEVRIVEITYKNMINKLNNVRSAMNMLEHIKLLSKQLEGINTDKLENFIKSPQSSVQLQSNLSKLVQIQFIEPPLHSSIFLKLLLDKDNFIKTKNQLTDRLKDIVLPIVINNNININNISNQINEKEKMLIIQRDNYQIFLRNTINKKQLENMLLSYQKQKIELMPFLHPNIKDKHKSVTELLYNTKKTYEEVIYAKRMLTKHKELETKKEKVLQQNNDLISLQRLKQNAIIVECKQLQDTVDNINLTMEDVLPLFFDEPINMMLQLYKVLKTNKQLKPGLNISIKYKGVEYDNINQLSGGEGDRISLALILSLNQVSNSPIILLDECISSLDGSLKESCVMAMKKMEGKTIICVDHEGVEGFYDNVIHVSN